MKNDARSQYRINFTRTALTYLDKHSNFDEPETAKAYIAQVNTSNSYKRNLSLATRESFMQHKNQDSCMRKLVVAESVTLDGVFEANTMAQWSSPYHSDEQGEYIKEDILTSDALLLGRRTYEFIAPYWPTQKNNEYGIADKMNSMPKYVVSSTLEKADWNNSTIIKGNIVEEITKLKQKPGQNILINGSANLVKSLMPTDLIDEYRFLVHPIIMGSGKRFFTDGMNTTKLKLVKTETFPLGVVLLCYKSAKN